MAQSPSIYNIHHLILHTSKMNIFGRSIYPPSFDDFVVVALILNYLGRFSNDDGDFSTTARAAKNAAKCQQNDSVSQRENHQNGVVNLASGRQRLQNKVGSRLFRARSRPQVTSPSSLLNLSTLAVTEEAGRGVI